jgi:hypothetical protein
MSYYTVRTNLVLGSTVELHINANSRKPFTISGTDDDLQTFRLDISREKLRDIRNTINILLEELENAEIALTETGDSNV